MSGGAAVVVGIALVVGFVLGRAWDGIVGWWYALTDAAAAWARLLLLCAGVIGILYVALRYGLPHMVA